MGRNSDMLEIAAKLAIGYIPFLFALCFHEMSHAFVARMHGDHTGERLGRLSMNPFVHADPIGTFVLPILATISSFPFFGWAKPVPVDSRNLKNPRVDLFWIALAGPLSNIFLALVSTLLLAFVFAFASGDTAGAAETMLVRFLQVNLVLAFFNLIPVHPLDGGKVAERFLPYELNRKMHEHQGTINMILLVFLMFGNGFRLILIPVEFFSNVLMAFATHFIPIH
jgi:Zn-dependent protease